MTSAPLRASIDLPNSVLLIGGLLIVMLNSVLLIFLLDVVIATSCRPKQHEPSHKSGQPTAAQLQDTAAA